MEPYPRTTRPVGAEAAAGGAPATTQAAQRLGSGVTDGHFWAPNHDDRRGHFSTRAVSKNVPDFGFIWYLLKDMAVPQGVASAVLRSSN